MTVSFKIISIGALEMHPLWNERQPVRTGHATTTLITSGNARILVDPGLPEQVLRVRLSERANLAASDITHVFLTSFRPDVWRGIRLFETATWFISEAEREAVGVPLATSLRAAAAENDVETVEALESHVAVLQRCQAAPDRLAKEIDLFPLPGVSPGLTGLLLPHPRYTLLICGDAIPTVEHLEQGKIPPWAADLDRARESFAEAIEVADLLIPGRDNLTVNPTKRPF